MLRKTCCRQHSIFTFSPKFVQKYTPQWVGHVHLHLCPFKSTATVGRTGRLRERIREKWPLRRCDIVKGCLDVSLFLSLSLINEHINCCLSLVVAHSIKISNILRIDKKSISRKTVPLPQVYVTLRSVSTIKTNPRGIHSVH